MTESSKFDMLESMTGETDKNVLLTYLTLAGDKVLQRAYPYDPDIRGVPVKYSTNQVEIACYLLNKRGAEGQTSHGENGINRSYESASVPESMLKNIVPFASVFSKRRD